jgi:hypothetical protein
METQELRYKTVRDGRSAGCPHAHSTQGAKDVERTKTKREQRLTSRVMIEDTCSINAGILNIISEVDPFCFTSPFIYSAPKDIDQCQVQGRGGTKVRGCACIAEYEEDQE